MDIRPWHIVAVIMIISVIGFAGWVVRAYVKGRRE
jgi:hypothetical protein